MALIKCPECGKEISDKAAACPNCGCPASEFNKTEVDTKCPECGAWVKDGENVCSNCGYEFPKEDRRYRTAYDEHSYEEHKAPFTGVYRMHLFGKKEEVYCPRCGSADCSIYHEQKVIPGKSKTSYTMNLNPLKPFTLVNKKEKVIKQDKIVTESKFVCNSCGHIFY